MAQKSASLSKLISLSLCVGLIFCFGGMGCKIQNFFDKKVNPSPSPSPVESPFFSANALRSKANAELLQEMVRVIFLRDPKDRGGFGSYVDSLNQGASIEGVYNGFTHSAAYREIETENPRAAAKAIKIFAEELAHLQQELKERTLFTQKSAEPLPRILNPDEMEDPAVTEIVFKKKSAANEETKLTLEDWAKRYERLFAKASFFTLKRILSDEALKVIAGKQHSKEERAHWYAKWVMRILERKVDFGLALRNKADEAFHRQWAMAVSEDRLSWEVLNRIHRVLNDANREPEKQKN